MAPSMERWTAIVAEPKCLSGGNQMGIKEGKRRLVLVCLLVIICNGPVKLDTKMLFESVSHNDRLDH